MQRAAVGRISLYLACVLFQSLPAESRADMPKSILSIQENKKQIAGKLSEPILNCVSRTDTSHAAFSGCIDWHSAVHGTWALVALQRVNSDPLLASTLQGVLTKDKMELEMDYLSRNPDFEMPYGRAWFLRLAIDHMKATDSDLLGDMAGMILISLIEHFDKKRIDVLAGSYNSATWALVNMLDYSRLVGDDANEKIILEMVRRDVDFWHIDCSYDLEFGHFMAVCTNIALLASRAMDNLTFDRWAQSVFASKTLPEPVKRPVGSHHYGLNFSRAWGFWELYSRTGQHKYAESYAAHFNATMGRPSDWNENYQARSHWVAQFGVFALQPLFGESKGR